jgi:hypothetical protein
MKVEISKELSGDPLLRTRVERANLLLEEIIGSAAEAVTAKWSRDVSYGLDHVFLDLFDATGASGKTVFVPQELTSEDYLRARFYRVWGDVLQDRSHKQLDNLSGRISAPAN